jgi:hypothetical protein
MMMKRSRPAAALVKLIAHDVYLSSPVLHQDFMHDALRAWRVCRKQA